MNSQTVQFWCRTKTGIGRHALDHLVHDLNSVNARKPLVITWKDPLGEDRSKPLVKAFRGSNMTLGIYDGVTMSSNMDTVRELVGLYQDGGFDAVLALGQGRVMDVAKVVNLAVSGSPNDLKRFAGKDNIPGPLNPLVHVATGLGSGRETSRLADLAGLEYDSIFMMPDIAVVDPRMIIPQPREHLLEGALILLASLAEAHAGTFDPLTRSYALVGTQLVMENLEAVLPGKKIEKRSSFFNFNGADSNVSVSLAHAAIINGYIISNMDHLMARELGQMVSRYCTATPGECMILLLPHVLTFLSRTKAADTEKLLLALEGLDRYCATPLKQRSGQSIYLLQRLVNTLFVASGGRIPRSLKDADMTEGSLAKMQDAYGKSPWPGLDSLECQAILEGAFESSPAVEQPVN